MRFFIDKNIFTYWYPYSSKIIKHLGKIFLKLNHFFILKS